MSIGCVFLLHFSAAFTSPSTFFNYFVLKPSKGEPVPLPAGLWLLQWCLMTSKVTSRSLTARQSCAFLFCSKRTDYCSS